MATTTKMILLPKNFEVSQVTYGTPKKLNSGGKIVPVYYNGIPLVIQTPPMRSPFGLQKWSSDSGSDKVKHTIELSFDDQANDILNMMQELDANLVKDGCTNSLAWMSKKNMSTDIAKALYTPIVKFSKDKATGEVTDKYPPTFKFTVPFSNDKFECEIYDSNKNLVDVTDISKGSMITAILQCQGVWIAGAGKFGCTWKALQMRVVPPKDRLAGFAFQMEEDDE